jgi:energy-converting hydrogenase Eha subunit G
MQRPALTLRSLAIALPAVFVLHVLEETPGFVAWFNRQVQPDITPRLFFSVVATGFIITLMVAAIMAANRDRAAAIVATAWIGFLMLANGIFHLVATLAQRGYTPGVVTGSLLYLPVSLLFFAAIARECRMPYPLVTGLALLGGIPMYIHGWLIVFRGSRLF